MELAILILLSQHGTLAFDRIAARLDAAPHEVRHKLTQLREAGLVDVLTLGERAGESTQVTSYWRLTEAGRQELQEWQGMADA
jgi:predicted ArsR family transcriptional regulator